MNLIQDDGIELERYWEINISQQHVDQRAFLHFPTIISKAFLTPQQRRISMVLQNTNISVDCEIRMAARNQHERYISVGFNTFLNVANIQPG
ncbi:unnamed protein product [Trifolium pratense]|uniref:Uncharacterized protein n=1 Tax=Trifolium pratense TaxID=57577 RepID=A0ACB0J7B2_TRIPR|nr:unnamed protein product [Trifolium pratense]